MKKRSVFLVIAGVLSAILFNTAMGAVVAMAVDVQPVYGAIAANGIGIGIGIMHFATQSQSIGNYAYAGLVREVWLAELMQKFRPNPAWLVKARSLSAYVDNGYLNLAEAGVDPDVILDYDGSAPIPLASGDDTPLAIPMRRLSTYKDRILSNRQATRSYDIRKDRVARHNKTLETYRLRYAGTAFSPSADGANTPVLATTGVADGNGFKAIKLNDIIDLHGKMRELDITDDLVLVLNSKHMAQLRKEDAALFKGFTGQQFTTEGFPLLGFTAFESNSTATYNKSTGARKAWLAAAAPSTDTISSFAFVGGEVGYANGTLQFFSKDADPDYQADEFNFAQQFQAVPMRNKGIGAIYTYGS